jgi:hypothetical protein
MDPMPPTKPFTTDCQNRVAMPDPGMVVASCDDVRSGLHYSDVCEQVFGETADMRPPSWRLVFATPGHRDTARSGNFVLDTARFEAPAVQ